MNNNDLLKKIERLFEIEREHTSTLIDTKLEPIKVTLQEHGKQFKTVNKKLNGVQKDIKLVLKYHDEMHIRLRERIEHLEEHTGLVKPPKN